MADARVVIKIEVNDADAQRQLATLEARLKALDSAGGGASSALSDVGNKMNSMGQSAKSSGMNLEAHFKKYQGLAKEARSLGNAFKPLIKFVKYAGIEFAGMATVMSGLKLVMIAGQAIAKGWSYVLQGVGAAAGLAVGALAGVLAAIRELNNAKIAPIAMSAGVGGTGPDSYKSQMSGLLGNKQLGMFKQQTLTGMAQSQYNAGGAVDANFRSLTQTMGNFAIATANPDKALASLTQTFAKAQAQGTFTAESIAAITKESPQLGKAIQASGMNVKDFMTALDKGQIDSLLPFHDALKNVNNTLIGKFKSALAGTKEQLTQLGTGITDQAKKPLDELDRSLHIFLVKVGPTVQRVMSNLIPEGATSGISRMMDWLAKSIITNMPKISGWADSLHKAFDSMKGFFSGMGGWLAKATKGFDSMYNNIIKPLGSEVWKTIEHAIMSFSDVMGSTGGASKSFGDAIHGVGEAVRSIIDGFATLKKVMAPIMSSFMTLVSIIAKLASNPLGGLVAAIGGMAMLTGRSKSFGMLGGGGMMGAGPKQKWTKNGTRGQQGWNQTAVEGLLHQGYSIVGPGAGGLGGGKGGGKGGGGMGLVSGPRDVDNLMHARAQTIMQRNGKQSVLNYNAPSAQKGGKIGLGGAMANLFTMGGYSRKLRGDAMISKPEEEKLMNRARVRMERMGHYAAASKINLRDRPTIAKYNSQMTAAGNDRYGAGGRAGESLASVSERKRQARAQARQQAMAAGLTGPAVGAAVYDAGRQVEKQAFASGATVGQVQRAGYKGQSIELAKGFTKEVKRLGTGGILAASMVGSIVGGTITSNAKSTNSAAQGFGGALSGAAMGASMGMAAGPYGAAAGAVIGGGIGLYQGLTGASAAQRAESKSNKEKVTNTYFGNLPKNDLKALEERGKAVQLAISGAPQRKTAAAKAAKALDDYRLGTKENEWKKGAKADAIKKAQGDNSNFSGGALSDQSKMDRYNKILAQRNTLDGQSTALIENARTTLQAKMEDDKKYGGSEKDRRAALIEAQQKQAMMVTNQQTNMETLSNVLGKTNDEAISLANTMDWDLQDSLVNIDKIMGSLGYSADKTASRAAAAGRILEAIMKPIEESRKLKQTNDALNAAGAQLFNYTGGNQEQIQTFAQDFIEQTSTQLVTAFERGDAAKGDPQTFDQLVAQFTKNYNDTLDEVSKHGASPDVIEGFTTQYQDTLKKLYGGQGGFGGRMAMDPLFAAAVQGKTGTEGFAGTGVKGATEQVNRLTSNGVSIENAVAAAAQGAMGDINKASGGMIAVDDASAKKALEGLIVAEMQSGGQQAANALKTAIESSKLNVAGKLQIEVKKDGTVLASTLTNVTGAIGGGGPAPVVPPGGYAGDPTGQYQNDTSTPRIGRVGDTATGRWGRTLGAHMAFTQGIAGNRTITSGLRNTNLGSGMSDHRFGNAYDLTGDNLGQYASTINGAGGFAEFHGSAGSRHLHVVPPTGDSSTPVGSLSGTGGGDTYSYNISVQGGANANANEIAQKVMTLIQETQRSTRERQ